MGDHGDSRELLHRSILEYLFKKKMYTAAEIFALESGIPYPPIVDDISPNGLLSEWWRLHYDNVFDRWIHLSNSEGTSSTTNPGNAPQDSPSMQMPTPYHRPQTFGSTVTPPPQQHESQMAGFYHSAQAVGPTTTRSSDAGNFLQTGPSTVMPMLLLLNPPQTASPTIMPTPGLPNSQQTSRQTMMPTSDVVNLQRERVRSTITPRNRFGTDPSPNFNMMLVQTMTNWIVARIHEQEILMLSVSRLFDANQIIHVLISSKIRGLLKKILRWKMRADCKNLSE